MSSARAQLENALADRYVVEGELGRGAASTGCLATDLRHNRKVALKALRPELSVARGADPFLGEIRSIEGETLWQKLAREKPLGSAEAPGIVRGLTQASGCAHTRGFVHSDIKPEKIMLQHDVPLLCDFGGGARAIDQAGGANPSKESS
jgi:serine/threonine-protein kinase